MDCAALTTLMDRWRPETHSFHLPCGELAPTLQDTTMILGLRLDRLPICAAVEPEGWHDTVEQMLGVRPPDPEQNKKDRKTTGVSSKWLRERFQTLPADPDQQTIESWGSVMFAYLYHQLCEEWWHHDEGSLPTVAFLGKGVIDVTGGALRRYLLYRNDLDVITQSQVEWEPYERDEVRNMNLSPVCTRDEAYWRYTGPLVYFYAVEWHLPFRVVQQFGRLQPANVETVTTSPKLHA
ncbi:hypothetical protein QOZ80_1BG0073310 [Eleusine coracana subsp. coracana]|nr:hypothetical protein QOZ80_1BG0073310 [Eleusine coracana subsp. coracana]